MLGTPRALSALDRYEVTNRCRGGVDEQQCRKRAEGHRGGADPGATQRRGRLPGHGRSTHEARKVVARNSDDSEDLRQLLDMLGLISANPDQPPPVVR